MGNIRLDKFISSQSSCTRSEATSMIKSGRVTINKIIVRDGSTKINTDKDEVTIDGKTLSFEEHVYFLLNKPAGVVSATEDNLHKTVCDLIDCDRDIFPVGRLDIDTEGLLLLTDDGELAHSLLAPKKHVDKTYYAKLDKAIPSNAKNELIARFAEGFDFGEEKAALPSTLEIISDTEIYLTLHEGKFHQVKRMFSVNGYEVIYLKRISMGKLKLADDLAPGEYKKIFKEDIL